MTHSLAANDGHYLVIITSRDTARSNLLQIADIRNAKSFSDLKFHQVIGEWGASWHVIANEGTLFYLSTNKDAPKDKLMRYNLSAPGKVRFPFSS